MRNIMRATIVIVTAVSGIVFGLVSYWNAAAAAGVLN